MSASAKALGRSDRVARNALILSVAQLGSRGLTFLYFIWLAIGLAPAGFGQYQVILSLVGVFLAVADAGIGTLTLRDVARDPQLGGDDRWPRFLAIAISGMAAHVAMIAAAVVIGVEPWLAALAGLALIPSNLALMAGSLFGARERMSITALLQLAPVAGITVFGGLALWLGGGVIGVVIGYVAGQALGGALALISLKELPTPAPINWSAIGPALQRIWRLSLPFGVQAVLYQLYVRLDLLLLNDAVPGATVGAYAAAARLIELVLLLPALVVTALTPLAATLQGNDPTRLRQVFEQQSRLHAVAGVGAAGAIILSAPQVIAPFGPGYQPATEFLQIMALSVVASYLNLPINLIITTHPNQRPVMLLAGALVGLALVFGLIGIALAGAHGMAWAKCAITVAGVFICTPLVVHLLGPNDYFQSAAKAIGAGLATFGCAGLLFGVTVLAAVVGSVGFVLAALALGLLTKQDRQRLLRLLPSRAAP